MDMSTETPKDKNIEPIYVSPDDYADLAYICDVAHKSGVSKEVINDAFEIAHENINKFSLENFVSALDIKLKLDNSVAKFYKR